VVVDAAAAVTAEADAAVGGGPGELRPAEPAPAGQPDRSRRVGQPRRGECPTYPYCSSTVIENDM
jgi:hypothetical protein